MKSHEKRISILACSILLTGCINLKETYLHSPTLAETAAQAEQSFADAGSQDLWQTMATNTERSLAAEKAVLAKSAEQRFEGKIQNIENLTWHDLRLCGQGSCWDASAIEEFGIDPQSIQGGFLGDQPTEEKLTFLNATVAEMTTSIQELQDRMSEHIPVAETTDLAMISSVWQSITKVENKIKEISDTLEDVKRNKIDSIQSEIDSLLEPILDPFPGQRREIRNAVESAISTIRANLEKVENLSALPRQASEQIMDAAKEAFPDDFRDNENSDANKLILTKIKGELLARLNKELEHKFANKRITEALKELDLATANVDAELARFEKQTAIALGGPTQLSKRINAVNDLFRKSESLNLVKLTTVEEMLGSGITDELRNLGDQLVLSEKFDELKQSKVSVEFTGEFEKTAGRPLCAMPPCKLQDVLNYLATDESKLQAIRTTLRDDFRRASITAFELELRTLRRELALLREITAVVGQQHSLQRAFGVRVDRHIKNYKVLDLDVTLYHDLDCLARSASNTYETGCAADTKSARDKFQNTLSLLADYFSMLGDLHEQEIALWIEIGRMKHRRSIEASQIAALTHEQMIASGLQGLTAFTQGGVTTEEIASILRYLNTALLTYIAVEL